MLAACKFPRPFPLRAMQIHCDATFIQCLLTLRAATISCSVAMHESCRMLRYMHRTLCRQIQCQRLQRLANSSAWCSIGTTGASEKTRKRARRPERHLSTRRCRWTSRETSRPAPWPSSQRKPGSSRARNSTSLSRHASDCYAVLRNDNTCMSVACISLAQLAYTSKPVRATASCCACMR